MPLLSRPALWFLSILLLGVVLLLTAGCKEHQNRPSALQTTTVTRTNLASTVTASGIVKPQVGASVKVGPRISGLLQRLYVRVGDTVRRGETLAKLEHSALDVGVRAAATAVDEAQAQLALAKAQYARRTQLERDGIVSQEALEIAKETLEVDKAGLESARTQLRTAQITRGYATVRAPISGTVTAISTQEGETVAASFAVPTFVTIMDLSRLQVDAYVDEVDIGKVHPGQRATFTVDAYPSETFNGRVQAVVPQAVVENNIVNYVVLIKIEGANQMLLRPEMTTSVSIQTGERHQALVLPDRAIRHDNQGNSFVTVLRNGGPVDLPVAIGEESGGFTRIRAGLTEGEKVLVPNDYAAASNQE